MPELDVAVVWPDGHDEELAALRRLTEARVAAQRAAIPAEVDLVVPISFGDRLVGAVGMLAGGSVVEAEASEFLAPRRHLQRHGAGAREGARA